MTDHRLKKFDFPEELVMVFVKSDGWSLILFFTAGLEEIYPTRGQVHEAIADQGNSLHPPSYL